MLRGGVPFRPVVEGLEERVVPYVLSGSQWASTSVTASFVPDGTTTQNGNPSNLFATLNASFTTATWQRQFARALQTWANSSQLNFHFVSDSGGASGSSGSNGDIRLAMSARSDGAVGYTFYPSGSSLGGDVFMSSGYTWKIGSYLDLYSCVLHEVGHGLGLKHSDVADAIMNPTISAVYTGLKADDIAGIQAIYGTRQNDSYDAAASNNTFGTASSIGLNGSGAASFNADLTSMGDVDYYKFTAPANSNGNLSVSVDATGISLLSPKVSVYDAAFNLVGTASASSYGGKATLNLSGLTAGATYYVVADGATTDEFGMGAYKLSAQFGQSAQPTVSVGNVSTTEGNSGAKQFNFTVSLSAASASTVTVNYATANGTATSGSDYTAASGTVTFAPGETSKTVTVNVTGDTTIEANETFVVNLTSPTNATIGTGQGTGTIQNDDVPTVSIGNVSLTEGNSGTKQFNFTVSLSAASVSTVTVNYATANGTASSASDYTAASGTVTFAPGETSKTVTVNVTGDTAVELDETFVVNLTSPANATIGTGQGTGTIQNDDIPTVSIGNVSLNEGNSGTAQFTFTVSLSSASPNTVTVQYATANGTATSGSDYTAASGTVTFAPGETSKTVTVLVTGDTAIESNETFVVNLTSPTNATLGTSQGTGTILNDDSPTLAIGNVSLTEGNSGTKQFTFTVSLSVASSNTVTVNYATANGTATSGSDYTAASGSVTFAPGETSKTVTVNVTGDTAIESNETFVVTLSSPANATIGTGTGTGTIQNDDVPTVSVGNVSLAEGNSGAKQFNFTVSLSAASASTVTVNYATANGTATSGSDYTAASGTVTFAPGETSKTVTVNVNGDTAVESNETFVVNLTSPANATLGTSQGTGTIQNDDVPTVSIGNVSVVEGNSGTVQLTFTVTLSTTSPNSVTVNYATADGTAVANSDYTPASGTLTFAAGQTQKTVTVLVNGDTIGEGHETFRLVLSSPTNATLANSQGTGTIMNDDAVRDRYEANDRPKLATSFGSAMGVAKGNLSLNLATDMDFYSFSPTRTRTFDVTVTPTLSGATINVSILNASRKLLASGATSAGPLTVTTALQGGKMYYVSVSSTSGSIFTYSLGVAKSTGAALQLAAALQLPPANTPVAPDNLPTSDEPVVSGHCCSSSVIVVEYGLR